MLEEVKHKKVVRFATTITSTAEQLDSLHSTKSDCILQENMVKTETNSKEDLETRPADSALDAQEEEDGSDPMEDAISVVTSTTPSADSSAEAYACAGDCPRSDDEAKENNTKKRVHFADDADSSSGIFRSGSAENLSSGKDSTQRSSLRKRSSNNVNPRPPHLARKQRETFQGDHVSITPADSLEFVVMDFQKETLDIINLKNVTEETVTYKVKTTAPEKYRVRPSTGVIKPGESADVNIYLPPGMHSTNRDKFLIMSLMIDASDSDKGASEMNELWKSASKDDIVEHRIRCVLVDHSQSSFAEEALLKDLADLKGNVERVTAGILALQKQCKDLEDSTLRNQFFLKIVLSLALALAFFTALVFSVSRKSGEDYCPGSSKYS